MINIEQFVDASIDDTSQGHYPCPPYHLDGKYTMYPKYGNCVRAYTMGLSDNWRNYKQDYTYKDIDPFGAGHYVTVGFKIPVVPQDIFIFETLNPGSVVRILGRYNELEWKLLWEGPPQVCPEESRKFSPAIRKLNCLINIIRLEFNREHLQKQTAIDAVLLKGYKFSEPLDQVKKFFRSEARSARSSGVISSKQVNVDENLVKGEDLQSVTRPFADSSSKQVVVDESPDLFSKLPDEIILLIFQTLDLKSLSKCAQVSKTWNKIAQDPVLYQNLSLKRYWYLVNGKTLESFKNRCKVLKKLDLSWCGQDPRFDEAFCGFLNCCDQLTHLSLCFCPFVNKSILQTISNSEKITELKLPGISLSYPSEFSYLAKLKELVTLDLSYTNIGYVELTDILGANPNLRHVCIDLCKGIKQVSPVASTVTKFNKKLVTWTAFGLDCWDTYEEPHFATCVDLESLNLGGWYTSRFRDIGGLLKKIAVNCRNLQRLGLAHWRETTDDDLLPIVKNCNKLIHLELPGVHFITSDVYEKALMSCPNLRWLDISFCHLISRERVNIWRQDYPHVTIVHILKGE